jgi:apolipoprotein D and lipocalin family protein
MNTHRTRRFHNNQLYALFLLFFILLMSKSNAQRPLQAVTFTDLNRYAGKWHEIASYPQRFQKGCHQTTAEYTLTDKGYVIVENRCNRDSLNGKPTYIKGKAFVEKNSGNSKLKVRFFWPFLAKYWIISLADDYSFAVVSHPNRNYLWILSRKPEMSPDVYNTIIRNLQERGFDPDKIVRTLH